MDYKLFVSTFFLIFLAELGDKTQLTAMMRSSASPNQKWLVFFAASAALVCSTLIAVLFGQGLTKLVDPKYIKLAAGGLFLILGGLVIYQAFSPEEEAEKPAAAVSAPNFLAKVVLEMAAEFETAAAKDYQRLAEECSDDDLRKLLLALSKEEEDHLARVREGNLSWAEQEIDTKSELPAMSKLAHDVAAQDKPILEHAIEHELATAKFYEELGKATIVPGLREVFSALAQEEYDHARRLEDFARKTG